jgi:hypothetical protein
MTISDASSERIVLALGSVFLNAAALLMTYTRAERVVGLTPRVIKHEAYRYVCGSCS